MRKHRVDARLGESVIVVVDGSRSVTQKKRATARHQQLIWQLKLERHLTSVSDEFEARTLRADPESPSWGSGHHSGQRFLHFDETGGPLVKRLHRVESYSCRAREVAVHWAHKGATRGASLTVVGRLES